MINIDNLKRNPTKIKKCFKKIGKSLITTENIKVIYPEKYESKNLAVVDSTVRLVSIFAILDDNNNYAVNNLPIFINLTPSNIDHVTIDNELYTVLEFEEGSTYTENTELIVNNKFLYDLFNLYYINGKIPWFMNYNDLINLFSKTAKYANSDLGSNPIISEILASIVAKSPTDKSILYREILKNNKKLLNSIKPTYVGLMNPFYTFDNTVSRISGSYYSKGLMGALINKEKETTRIEEILRK